MNRASSQYQVELHKMCVDSSLQAKTRRTTQKPGHVDLINNLDDNLAMGMY